MKNNDFDTLSLAINTLSKNGYSESFEAREKFIEGIFSKKQYHPEELSIVESHRFEGMTNPSDQTVLFAIEAKDGTKGTLVMSYQAEHSQNVELIKMIKDVSKNLKG